MPYYQPQPKYPEGEGPSTVWPREYHILTLPISALHSCELKLRKTMTARERQTMQDALDVMRRVVVLPPVESTS
jgi:hypothetical protein